MIHSESGAEAARELTPAELEEGRRLRADVDAANEVVSERREALAAWIRKHDRAGVAQSELARATKLTRGRVWQIVERRR
jgi:hypothetical protein